MNSVVTELAAIPHCIDACFGPESEKDPQAWVMAVLLGIGMILGILVYRATMGRPRLRGTYCHRCGLRLDRAGPRDCGVCS